MTEKKHYFKFFSEASRNVITKTVFESGNFGLENYTPECLLLGILKDNSSHSANLLRRNNLNIDTIRILVKKHYSIEDIEKPDEMAIYPDPNCRLIIEKAFEYSKKFKMNSIEPDLFVLAMLEKPEKSLIEILEIFNVNFSNLYIELIKCLNYFNSDISNYYRSNPENRIFNSELIFNSKLNKEDKELYETFINRTNKVELNSKKKPKLIKKSKSMTRFDHQFKKRDDSIIKNNNIISDDFITENLFDSKDISSLFEEASKSIVTKMDLKNIKLKEIDEENLFKFDSKIKDEFEYQTKETIDPADPIESRNIPNNNNKIIEKLPNELIKTFTGLGENSEDTTYNSTSSSVLSEYAIDLTEMASSGQLDPVLGRISEIERLMQILVRRRKNNAILIGEPGVGKTAVVEGLALRIVSNKTSDLLYDKKIMTLELSALLAGTKYRGEFEERLKNIIDEVKINPHIILFIDEIHTIIGAGGIEGGNNDAAQILKPALARGEFQCIGATTITEYEKFFKKDAALDRRFQIVLVPEPSIEDSINIINGLRIKYEQYHDVFINDDALIAAVNLSAQFITDRFLPDKALDLIDEACASLRMYNIPKDLTLKKYSDELKIILYHKQTSIREQNYLKAGLFHAFEIEKRALIKSFTELLKPDNNSKNIYNLSVKANDIATLVSLWSGIPVNDISENESKTLIDLENILHSRVIGQNVAISAIARAIRRSRVGLKSLTRPIASFIFAGPTGVGKTELAKSLALFVFGSENAMVRLDMSEYMERFNISKLIGSPPGYVGYSEGGILTEAVRKKPYTLVLFDELEKAHLDIYNLLLQILEDGRLTDSQAKLINFKNTIIILTSNLGAKAIEKIQKSYGDEEFRSKQRTELMYTEMSIAVKTELKEKFRPEFLNRLDDIIIFEPLTRQNIREITELMINGICKRTENKMGITLLVDANVKLKLSREGYDPEYGARPLRRAITSLFEDQFANILLKENYQKGTILNVTLNSSRNVDFVYFNKKTIENSNVIDIIKEGLINELDDSEDLENLKKINDIDIFFK